MRDLTAVAASLPVGRAHLPAGDGLPPPLTKFLDWQDLASCRHSTADCYPPKTFVAENCGDLKMPPDKYVVRAPSGDSVWPLPWKLSKNSAYGAALRNGSAKSCEPSAQTTASTTPTASSSDRETLTRRNGGYQHNSSIVDNIQRSLGPGWIAR